jgi:hypothetical protein
MIKAIMGSPVVRKTLMGAMVTGAIASATFNVKAGETESGVKTEMTSSATVSSPVAYTQTETHSTRRNAALDAKVIATSENAEVIADNKAFLDEEYALCGTFATTLEAQSYLDHCNVDKAIDDYYDYSTIFGGTAMDRDAKLRLLSGKQMEASYPTSQIVEFKDFVDESLFPQLNGIHQNFLKQNPKPSAEAVSKHLDKVAEAMPDKASVEAYKDNVKDYVSKMPKNMSVQDYANLISYKTCVLDYLYVKLVSYQYSYTKENGLELDRILSEKFLDKSLPANY